MLEKMATSEKYMNYVNLIVGSLKRTLKKNLISVVLFGSVAREEAVEGSDIDILLILKTFENFKSRFDVFNEIEKEMRTSKEYRDLEENKLGTLISPVPLTSDEIKKNPPILLDVVTDGIILYDTDNFMKTILTNLKKRLEEIGARKIILGDGKWFWDLKPDYKLGEVVEI
ncbi:MAG: nucleotidyltransferase domain-containing protein [archaeon]|nr:nucleotidyltransferase domain-containing protein [archaeon]